MTERHDPSPAQRYLRSAGQALLAQPRWLAWLAPLAWAAMLFLLSTFSGPVDDRPVFPMQGFIWNFAHPVLFGLLALLVIPVAPRRALGQHQWTAMTGIGALWTVLLVTLYGFTDELHQSTVPGRDASLLDVCSDGVGAAAVVAVVLYLGRPDANSRGLWIRFLGGLGACIAVAGLATGWDVLHGEGLWPF